MVISGGKKKSKQNESRFLDKAEFKPGLITAALMAESKIWLNAS